MKKLILLTMLASNLSFAGTWFLKYCTWGQYGYEYGNKGIYESNGDLIEVFFKSGYCPQTIQR